MSKSSILMYDIPTRTNFPNPTARLWRCGTRLNLSCWVVRADLTPWTLLNEMKDAGVRWHLLPFSDADSKEATALMLGNIRDELRAAQQREAKSLREQDATLAQAEAACANDGLTQELQRARNKHAKDRAATVKRTEKIVKLLKESASLFALDVDFSASENRVRALKALNGARATLYTQMVDAVQNTPLAVAANENSVPAGILADYAEETTGGDYSAARAAFDNSDDSGATGGVIATSSSNNNAATISRPRWSVQPRTYSVSTRTGTTTVTSGFANAEAMEIVRDLSGNSFARSLSRQFDNRGSLSTSQWKWVHIIAVQNTPEMQDALAPEEIETVQEPVIETPIETPVVSAPAPQVTIDDTVPGETVNPDPLAEEITTQNMTWTSANKTLTCEASSVNCRAFTKNMRVKSHKTGSVKTFTLDREIKDNEGEVLSVIYTAADGTTLVILND